MAGGLLPQELWPSGTYVPSVLRLLLQPWFLGTPIPGIMVSISHTRFSSVFINNPKGLFTDEETEAQREETVTSDKKSWGLAWGRQYPVPTYRCLSTHKLCDLAESLLGLSDQCLPPVTFCCGSV